LKDALAEALDTCRGTISRQCQIRDLPVQLRTLGAMKELLPALYRDVIAEVRATLGDELETSREELSTEAATSRVRCISKLGAALAHLGLEVLDDNEISPDEAKRYLAQLDEHDRASREARMQLTGISARTSA
jgi:hypothetical protein